MPGAEFAKRRFEASEMGVVKMMRARARARWGRRVCILGFPYVLLGILGYT